MERNRILDAVTPLSGRILEVGTGKGHFALALAKRGIPFTSLDISKKESALAGRYLKFHKLKRFVQLRVENKKRLPFPDQSFDVVFSVNALHHFENPLESLEEFVRILKPKGRLVLSDFTEKGFKTMDRIHALDGNAHGRGKIKLREIKNYFLKKKFNVQKSTTAFLWTLVAENSQ